MWATIVSGKIWTGEIKNRAKDGSFYWVFTSIAPGICEEGIPPNYISIRFDITEKKIIEEKLYKLELDLNNEIFEREINCQYLSGLGHDLKTPLTIAKMASQILQKHSPNEKLKNLSIKILDNINRADSLINGIMDASRGLKSQNYSMDIAELDLRKSVLEVFENLKTIHGDRFKLEASGDFFGLWSLSGIKRILENLLINAIKYGDKEAPIIVKLQDDITSVMLSVYNKGEPISKCDQKSIFEFLKRCPKAEFGDQFGLGIGLAVVKNIAEGHKGSVRVYSSTDIEGTIFTVILPKNLKDCRGF